MSVPTELISARWNSIFGHLTHGDILRCFVGQKQPLHHGGILTNCIFRILNGRYTTFAFGLCSSLIFGVGFLIRRADNFRAFRASELELGRRCATLIIVVVVLIDQN